MTCVLALAATSGGTGTARSTDTTAATGPFGCIPHAGLGSVALVRAGEVHVVDLASCRERAFPLKAPNGVTFTSAEVVRAASARLVAPGGGVTAITRERTLLLVLPHDPFKQLFGRDDTIARVFLDVILRDLVATLRLTLRPHARLAASV